LWGNKSLKSYVVCYVLSFSVHFIIHHWKIKHSNNGQPLARHSRLVQYANSLDLNEMPNNSASHPDLSFYTLRKHVNQLWVLWKYR